MLLQESTKKKSKKYTQYIRKKVIYNDLTQKPWDLNQILQSPYVDAVILKTSVGDDSLSFSFYSKKIISYVNNQTIPLQFFCDGFFSFINHLQLLIIGTRLVFEQSDSRQNNKTLSGFYPFAILIINRKTTAVYQRFFQELHDAGGLQWKDDLWSGMTDIELRISNAAKNVFSNSN